MCYAAGGVFGEREGDQAGRGVRGESADDDGGDCGVHGVERAEGAAKLRAVGLLSELQRARGLLQQLRDPPQSGVQGAGLSRAIEAETRAGVHVHAVQTTAGGPAEAKGLAGGGAPGK